MKGKYDDIIELPHHVSSRHAPMSMADRAGQFSPFAALVGHDAAIQETGRLTEQQAELDESRKAVLNDRLLQLLQEPGRKARITWFRPDDKKQGGAYVKTEVPVKGLEPYGRWLEMADGAQIPLEQIYEIAWLDGERPAFSDNEKY